MASQMPGAWVEDPPQTQATKVPEADRRGVPSLSEPSTPYLQPQIAQREPFWYDLVTAFTDLIVDAYKRHQVPKENEGPIPGMFLLKTGPPIAFHKLQFSTPTARKEYLARLVSGNPALKVRVDDPNRPVLKLGVDFVISPCYDRTAPEKNHPTRSPSPRTSFNFGKGSPTPRAPLRMGSGLIYPGGSSVRRPNFSAAAPISSGNPTPAVSRRSSFQTGFVTSPLTPVSQKYRVNKPRANRRTRSAGSSDIFIKAKDLPGQDMHEGHSCVDIERLARDFMSYFLQWRALIPRSFNSEIDRKLQKFVQRYVDEQTKGMTESLKDYTSKMYKQAWYNIIYELQHPTESRPGTNNPDGTKLEHPWIHGDEFIHSVTTELAELEESRALWRFNTSMNLAETRRVRQMSETNREWYPDLFSILNRKVAPHNDGWQVDMSQLRSFNRPRTGKSEPKIKMEE